MRVRKLVLPFVLVALAGCDGGSETTTLPPGADSTVASTTSTTSVPSTDAPDSTTNLPPATTGPSGPETTQPPLQGLEYTTIAEASFPIIVTARSGDPFALAATRGGVVRVLDEEGLGDVVVDISARTTVDGERGLLGLARHPEDDGRLFLHYTDRSGDTVVSEMPMTAARADPDSEQILLTVSQPARNHNGGMIQFGPDGALYLGLGDGGGAGDRYDNGQNTDTLLGGLVRIDVDTGEATLWQYGLRNPWRFWIDGDRIWIADVGQGAFEEIDLADVTRSGVNYGWPLMEGAACYAIVPCEREDLTLPLVEIARGDGGSCAVTGGVVYRGSAIPELDGRFLFSDYCGGYLRSVGPDGTVEDHTDAVGTAGQVVSFGVDGDGEVYVLTPDRILRIDPVR
jgi:glucose/arabinose dehydrogenase